MATSAAPRNKGGKQTKQRKFNDRKFCQRSDIPRPDPSIFPEGVDGGTVDKLFASTTEPCTVYAKTKIQLYQVPWCEGTWRLCDSCQTVFVIAATVMKCSSQVTRIAPDDVTEGEKVVKTPGESPWSEYEGRGVLGRLPHHVLEKYFDVDCVGTESGYVFLLKVVGVSSRDDNLGRVACAKLGAA